MKKKVLIVDDHEMFRRVLISLINSERDLECVGEAVNGMEALKSARRLKPDIILMDIKMPVMDGITTTRMIKRELPDVHVIGLSVYNDDGILKEMMSAGASSCCLKDWGFEALVKTIRENA